MYTDSMSPYPEQLVRHGSSQESTHLWEPFVHLCATIYLTPRRLICFWEDSCIRSPYQYQSTKCFSQPRTGNNFIFYIRYICTLTELQHHQQNLPTLWCCWLSCPHKTSSRNDQRVCERIKNFSFQSMSSACALISISVRVATKLFG